MVTGPPHPELGAIALNLKTWSLRNCLGFQGARPWVPIYLPVPKKKVFIEHIHKMSKWS